MATDEAATDRPPINPTTELDAMRTVLKAVQDLPPESIRRVLTWAGESLGIGAPLPSGPARQTLGRPSGEDRRTPDSDLAMGCTDAASFVQATGASDGIQRALAVAYWIQVVGGKDSWTGAEVNDELKHQGHRDSNITRTLDHAKAKKPALVVQLQKSGSSKQARKLYKLTTAAVTIVRERFRGEEAV